MNRLFASTLSVLNVLAGLAIVVAGIVWGWNAGGQAAERAFIGAVVGGLVGLALAGLVCGVIALLILIERHLRTLVGLRAGDAPPDDHEPPIAVDHPRMTASHRREPTL